MHELSVCESLLGVLSSEARARHFTRVKAVRLELGAFSCVAADALDFCFTVVSRGTLAENARLDVVRLTGQAWCLNCGETVGIAERYAPCPQCGTYELQISGGDEMRVIELEVE